MNILKNNHVIPVLRALNNDWGSMWVGRIEKHRSETESSQSAPNPVQVQETKRLQPSLTKAYQFDFVLLVVGMLVMAAARYL